MRNTTYRFEAGVAPRFDVLCAEMEGVFESQNKAREQADDALRLASERYHAGTGTHLDVLNAQTSLMEVRTTQIEVLHVFRVALVRFQSAIGQDVSQPQAI